MSVRRVSCIGCGNMLDRPHHGRRTCHAMVGMDARFAIASHSSADAAFRWIVGGSQQDSGAHPVQRPSRDPGCAIIRMLGDMPNTQAHAHRECQAQRKEMYKMRIKCVLRIARKASTANVRVRSSSRAQVDPWPRSGNPPTPRRHSST